MGSETILLVDDNPDVRICVSEMLKIDGFDVLEAADGADALRIAETTPQPIEVLVTDINMPGIDGLELARRVRTLRPAIGVVYMSGASPDLVEAWDLLTGTAFLHKPFGPDVLVERVRGALVQAGERARDGVRPRMPIGRG
jgi:DNA-binding response OmpR family regulator